MPAVAPDAADAGGDILDDLAWRGLLVQSTDLAALREALAAGPVTLYCGFDPTAPSLHAGSLVPLLTLRRFQLAGHRPIALSGGATGLIGDPSGRSTERVLTDASTVAAWTIRMSDQIARFLDVHAGPAGALLVDNLEWTAPLPAIEFLRDVGKHFSVNQMLAKDSVSARLAAGISFTEFAYMLLQSYDFLELRRRYGCVLQVGGNDQWGNITAGLDLIRKVTGGTAHGLTLPLVTTASGEKFGKSTGGGSLWLDPALTPPYVFHQYWLNTDDRDVNRYLRIFTFLPRERIEELEAATVQRPRAREAQRALADELTTLVHGAGETERVKAAARALFLRDGLAELAALDEATLLAALDAAGTAEVDAAAMPAVPDLFVAAGLCASRSEARRAVEQGGAYLNNERLTDAGYVPTKADLLFGQVMVLRRGQRHVAGIRAKAAAGDGV